MSYPDFQWLVADCQTTHSPSELQGRLIGHLLASTNNGLRSFADDLSAELGRPLSSESDQRLQVLTVALIEALEDPATDLQLALPSDDEPVVHRARALARWCGGFLSALGSAAAQRGPEVLELLADLERISRTRFVESELGEEAEADLFELTEYAQMAVRYIHES